MINAEMVYISEDFFVSIWLDTVVFSIDFPRGYPPKRPLFGTVQTIGNWFTKKLKRKYGAGLRNAIRLTSTPA